jgi:hypothetical protein
MDKLILSWGTAYEFLMLSALEHPDSARCILVDEAPETFRQPADATEVVSGRIPELFV